MADHENNYGMPQWLRRILVGDNPKHTLVRLGGLVVVGVVAFLLLNFVFLPVRITGPSMSPTFKDGQINFVNRLAYAWNEPKRGDVVGLKMAGKHVMYYKRIVGMPGESVSFEAGRVQINGQPLDEPYLPALPSTWYSQPKQLGEGEYYFVGDNRTMPFEDHDKGSAPRKRIIGKVVFRGSS